jgi:hypothetical protein
MTTDGEPQQPITIAQAWSAPIVMCAMGVGFAVWGLWTRPEAADVTAALIIMIVGPVTAAALIARGLVGVYRKRYWSGGIAIVAGILLFTGVVVGLNAVPWRGDTLPQW